MAQIFDIEDARDLFDIVEHRFASYCSDPEKATEDIIAIIMITNHLREWIAPGFDRKKHGWPEAVSANAS